MDRATKYALKDVAKQFEDILKTRVHLCSSSLIEYV